MPIYHEDERIRVHKVNCGPYNNNSYIVVDPTTDQGVVIDAPAEPEKVLREIGHVEIKALLITHNHPDHLLGFEAMDNALGATVVCHKDDAAKIPRTPDLLSEDNQRIQLGNLELRIIHTPGHTPGSACIFVEGHLFTGDTLFPGGPGRSNNPKDFQQEVASIVEKLFALPGDAEIYPGHGDNTTLQKAREEYEVFNSRLHKKDLCGDVTWMGG